MKRNEKGFSVVEGLLIVVIVGLIGFVGWFVWHSKNNADKNLNTASSTATNTNTAKKTTATPTSTIPSNFTTYENKDFGFSLSYPKDWGRVTTTAPTNNSKLLFAGTFDKQSDVSFAIAPKDYSPTDSMGDPPCFENGFGSFSYLEVSNSQYYYSKELVRTDSRQVVESYKNGYCAGGKLQGRIKLNLSKSNGLDITYFKKTAYDSSSIQDYMKNKDNLVSESLKSDFLKVVDTVSAL